MNDTLKDTLSERTGRYGDFRDHARIAQNLQTAMHDSPNWATLPAMHKEALQIIQHKIARILNGDPNYADNWHDIQGYAKLVEDRLEEKMVPVNVNITVMTTPAPKNVLLDNASIVVTPVPAEDSNRHAQQEEPVDVPSAIAIPTQERTPKAFACDSYSSLIYNGKCRNCGWPREGHGA